MMMWLKTLLRRWLLEEVNHRVDGVRVQCLADTANFTAEERKHLAVLAEKIAQLEEHREADRKEIERLFALVNAAPEKKTIVCRTWRETQAAMSR